MENRYRTNLKKVYLSDQELIILNKNLLRVSVQTFLIMPEKPYSILV